MGGSGNGGDVGLLRDVKTALPRVVALVGGTVLLVATGQALLALADGVSVWIVLFDLLFAVLPGGTLVYAGYWLPRSDVSRQYYPRIVAWVVGGVAVMFGFILLRDLHPGVSADWTVGTQAIALMIGSIGGLLIGIQETRARIRTTLLEERTRELQERERELERQNEQLEQFANVVSHDLRNPLGIAIGRLEVVREESDSEHLDVIEDALDRMDALIEDLLTLAQNDDTVVHPEPIEIGAIFEGCWQNVETIDATLHVDIDRVVVADEGRLKQLIENLIRNSVEHGGEHVTITVGELADGFYVEDTGPGIPEEDRAEVFDTGYSKSRDGTGFGLSIVEQVVDAHGWTIAVTEGSDGGARFEITDVERHDREPTSVTS